MATLHVEVTEQDIADGVRGDCEHCAIVLAMRRLFPSAHYIWVDGSSTGIWNGRIGMKSRSWTLPESALEFIEHFDASEPVWPFSFDAEELEVGA